VTPKSTINKHNNIKCVVKSSYIEKHLNTPRAPINMNKQNIVLLGHNYLQYINRTLIYWATLSLIWLPFPEQREYIKKKLWEILIF